MFSRINTIYKTIKMVKNWLTIIYSRIFNRPTTAVFRNGYQFNIDCNTWSDFTRCVSFFKAFPEGQIKRETAQVQYGRHNLIFQTGGKLALLGNIIEIFGQKVYEPFLEGINFQNRTVVDIGALIGDTAIYFALKGAERVYAYEPVPSYYELAKKNIEANALENQCSIFNVAVGAEKRNSNLGDPTFQKMFVGDDETAEYGSNQGAPMTTLQEIASTKVLTDALLKLDCEGYEYDIILNSSDKALRKFKYIIMEYHYGFERLKEKLEKADFLVKHTRPQSNYITTRPEKFRNLKVGYLFAKRLD